MKNRMHRSATNLSFVPWQRVDSDIRAERRFGREAFSDVVPRGLYYRNCRAVRAASSLGDFGGVDRRV